MKTHPIRRRPGASHGSRRSPVLRLRLLCTLLLVTAGLAHAQSPRAPTAKYIDVSLDALFSAGWATAGEERIGVLQGGAHDPKKRGFTVQNVELSLLGAVDPYLTGESHFVFQLTPEGESLLEVEEVFLTTLALPAGLQAKAGHFFVEFGRLNARHPHTWSFADQPVVNTRMFGGDGLRCPGARLSWLAPLPWYADLRLGVHNANGETAFSFLGAAEEAEGSPPGFAGHPFVGRQVSGLEDLLYTLRWLNSWEVGETTVNLGLSGLLGPNATGQETRTRIAGADLFAKWRPARTVRGWPFMALQGELMNRRYEVPSAALGDWGFYLEGLWGFRPCWVGGLRFDWADGDGGSSGEQDPLRDRRYRLSPALSFYPTEFSKLRLQVNRDVAEHLRDEAETAIWLQYEFLFGAHPGHQF